MWKWEPDLPYQTNYTPYVQPPTTVADPLMNIRRYRKFLKKMEEELKPKDDKKDKDKDGKKGHSFSAIETIMLTCMLSFVVGPVIGLAYFVMIANILQKLH